MAACLEDLPNELIVHLASFLEPVDFVRFTLTSRRFFHLFDDNTTIWKKRFARELGEPCPTLQKLGKKLLDSGKAITDNPWKLFYMMQQRTMTNLALDEYGEGDLIFPDFSHTSRYASLTGTIVFLIPPNDEGQFRIELCTMKESGLEWSKRTIFLDCKLFSNEVPERIDSIVNHGDKYVIKIACADPNKRLIICYDMTLGQIKWCKVALYSMYNFTNEYDNVVMNEKSYIIICWRAESASIFVYDMNDGLLVNSFDIFGTKIGPFFQISPNQNLLIFTLVFVEEEKCRTFSLNLNTREAMRPFLCGNQVSSWSYPLAILNSSAVMCDDDGFSVWSLETSKCEYKIPFKHDYLYINAEKVSSYDKVDIVASAWEKRSDQDRILHMLKIKDASVTLTSSFEMGALGPGATSIGNLGDVPLVTTACFDEDTQSTEITVAACEKNTISPERNFSTVPEDAFVCFLTPFTLGIDFGSSFQVRDYLLMDSYTMK